MDTRSGTTGALPPRILNSDFRERDHGLPIPILAGIAAPRGPSPVPRSGSATLQTARPMLRIDSPDRGLPPGYREGGVPREPVFNSNVLAISAAPRMPEITVRCTTSGIDPRRSPIYWRLQCRHVLARHINTGDQQYAGACEAHQDEWHGRSSSAEFVLFGAQRHPAVVYDFNDEARVMGGHAILTVAARPPGSRGWVYDHAHLRIVGTNPTRAVVEQYVERLLHGRDPNVVAMLRAIFVHESGYTQFHNQVQTANRAYGLRFDWPDDPARYPLATFDFGVGISQSTRSLTQRISRGVAWDWRENVRAGTNLFLTDKLRGSHRRGRTWQQWAREAWRRYNGSGERALRYAANMAASPEGRRVSARPVPPSIDLRALTAYIPGPEAPTEFPAWPPAAAPTR